MVVNGLLRNASASPKRKLADRDGAMDDHRPLKKRTPSLSPPRSLSPLSSTKGKPSGGYPGALSNDAEGVEETKILFALTNQLAFKQEEADDEAMFAKYREKAAKRKEARKEQDFQEMLLAKKRMLQASIRMRDDKSSKKKRLAAQRRKLEREASEKSLKEAKEEYDKFLESIQKVRLSDDESLDESGSTKDARGRDKRKLRIGERELLPPVSSFKFLEDLSDDWERKVVEALGVRSEAAVLAKSIEGVEISRKDIGRLLPRGQLIAGAEPWLNDEVINAWYANLCARMNEKDGYVKGPNNVPKWVAYSTAWYENATKRGPQSIANWSRRKGIKNEKLLKTERIFFPTNSGMHWTLLTISGKNRTIEYLDSLNEYGYQAKKYTNLALGWLKMELGSKFVESDWTVLHTKSALQNNVNDCGMFACLNGLALVKGIQDPSVEFGADDIPLGRRMFVATLLNGGFMGDFDL